MAIDTDQIDEVLAALASADSVDARGIRVDADGDAVVLRGAVATHEESAAAQQVAQERADSVRNELAVDTNLRETGDMEPPSAATVGEATRRKGLQGSSFDPLEGTDDLVTDVQESLDENVSWDPPHAPVEVPTRAESRGVAGGGAGVADSDAPAEAELDEPSGTIERSLPDVSAEELTRAAHPQPAQEDTN
jgi:hypothetical protein